MSMIVCIENLNMQAMAKSLNFGKSVSDNGWGMFTAFLKYKLEELGKRLVQIGKFFASSQICNVCGYQNKNRGTHGNVVNLRFLILWEMRRFMFSETRVRTTGTNRNNRMLYF